MISFTIEYQYIGTYPKLADDLEGQSKINPESDFFFPGGGLVSVVDTFAGLFGKKQKPTLFERFSMKLTKAQTTEIVLFKRNNGK